MRHNTGGLQQLAVATGAVLVQLGDRITNALTSGGMAQFIKEVGSVACFTGVANQSGQPAMSLPLDQTATGIPLGSQFIGRFGDEGTLYQLAGQLEAAHPWFERTAPMQGR